MNRVGRRRWIGSRAAVLAVLIGAGTLAAVGVAGQTPAGAIAGCKVVGGSAIGGNIKVPAGGPKLTRAELNWKSETTDQDIEMAGDVNPNSTKEFRYCGKGLFTWPTEVDAKYRINGPNIGSEATGYIVKIHQKIPFKGDNEASCTVEQEYGPADVDPFYCSMKNTSGDSYGRYVILHDFTIGKKSQQVLTDPNERARRLSEFCSKGDTHQCKYDPSTRITDIAGPEELIDSHASTCTSDSPYTFSWNRTVGTTESNTTTGSATVNIGKLLPILSFSLSHTYGYTLQESQTLTGSVTHTIPKASRLGLFQSALMNSVSGNVVLSGTNDTLFVIRDATFKWPSPKKVPASTTPRVTGRLDC